MELKISFLQDEKLPVLLSLEEGSTILQIRKALDDEKCILVVNGVARPDSYVLSANDSILSMPILEGG